MISECVFSLLLKSTIVAAALFCIIYLYFKYAFTYWKKRGVPYLEPVFPYGNSSDTVKIKKPLGEVMITSYNKMKEQGAKFCGMYFFHFPIFIPIRPDLIKNIMSRDFSHFVDRGVYHDEENDPLSAHLFSLNGQKWKNLRAKLTPTFTSGKLKNMFQTLVDCSLELKNCLNESINKTEPIDIKQILVQYTTDVIGSCAFGIECNSFKNPNTEFIQSGKKSFRPSGLDRVKLLLAFITPSIANFFKVRITNKNVGMFYQNLVKDTIEYREKNNVTRNDFMQLLIQLKNKGKIDDDDPEIDNNIKVQHEIGTTLSLNEVVSQVFLFFSAGFETSSTAMTFCLFELSQNQDIQNKVRQEIINVLKKHNGKITYEGLIEMHYMERVVQESMRKYPPIMLLQREVTADYNIPDSNVVLIKGSKVMIPTLAIHLDPEYYPEPNRFDPERFTEENKATRPDYTWLAFGGGPRACIGFRFGMMQIKVGLSQLLLNYKFTLNPKTKTPIIFDPKAFITSSLNKIWLNAERTTH